MSLRIASLNSGSNGNCYYIGNAEEAVLVDAGISCREIEKRLSRLSLPVKQIKAVFISHEHTDHIRGVEVFSRKHRIPVYITAATLAGSGLQLQEDLCFTFRAYQPVEIGALTVNAFPKFHDASDPHSFMVSGHGLNIGVFTDIGTPCEHVIKHFGVCHAAFLESNYDEDMLMNGAYPYYLKKRISGNEGHLSNDQALKLYAEHRSPFLSHVLLSHLSRENNSPQLVEKIFSANASGAQVVVASRDYETAVYHISGRPLGSSEIMPASAFGAAGQFNLF
jgi:phosphoribosyl 1,2-cyclic phosphodiesterase